METARVPLPLDSASLTVVNDGLIFSSGDNIHTFNVTGREIVELFDGVRSCGDIIAEMQRRYPDDETVDAAVGDFFNTLDQLSILKTA